MAWIPTVIALVLLAAIPFAVLIPFGTPRPYQALLAVVRGALQLSALTFILNGIIADPGWVVLALCIMATAAALVSGRRIAMGWKGTLAAAVAIAAGCVTTAVIVFASGAIAPTPRYLLAFVGILIGNAMSIVTLSGRNLRSSAIDHWDEIEGWLALGATPRQASILLARQASFSALVPSIDQTRTTGLVVLPGAFVGAIFGGLSPFEAGVFQILVLTGIIASGSIASVTVLRFIGPLRHKPLARL